MKLTQRTGTAKLPSVYVADMREELKRGNRSILSDHLRELMEDRDVYKRQALYGGARKRREAKKTGD